MNSAQLDRFLSWARYLYWSDILYSRWIEFSRVQDTVEDHEGEWQTFALSAQWFASVWVVIEGWRENRMYDAVIDRLLIAYPDFCELLRRFRNGVYHYQPELFDQRQTDLPRNGDETHFWVYALFYEFKRYFWEWPAKHSSTPEVREELEKLIRSAIGWRPTDILHARAEELNKLKQEAERMLAEGGDASSESAQDLQSAIVHLQETIQATDMSPALAALPRLSQKH